jgi:hypothetical protein
MPYIIDTLDGGIQYRCSLSYRISKGYAATHWEPGEPDTIEDLRVHCLSQIQIGTGLDRIIKAPTDARENAAYLKELNKWLQDNLEVVEKDIWEYEAEKRYQEVD